MKQIIFVVAVVITLASCEYGQPATTPITDSTKSASVSKSVAVIKISTPVDTTTTKAVVKDSTKTK